MNLRTLPRKPPEPFQGERLVKHFELSRRIFVERAEMAGGLSAVTTRKARSKEDDNAS